MTDSILSHFEHGVMTITLNRPEVFNSFNQKMGQAFQQALDAAAQLGQSVPLGSLARSLYTLHKQQASSAEKDAGRLDFSSIQKLFLVEA